MTAIICALHGFCRQGSDFDGLRVRSAATGWLMVAPDLPGWGQSPRDVDANYGYAAQAERLAHEMKTEHATGVFLLGHSMGAGIAVMLAAHHPEWVRGLLLLAPGGARHAETPFSQAVQRGEQPLHVASRENAEYVHQLLYGKPHAMAHPLSEDACAHMLAHADLAFEQRVLDGIARGKQSLQPSRAAKRVKCPVHVMVGEQDQVIHPDVIDAYQRAMPQAQTTVLPSCGHMLMDEAPQSVHQALVGVIQASQ